MLNINTRISLSKAAKRIIKAFCKKNSPLTVDAWKSIRVSVKNEISKKLLLNQRLKCAYCERHLYALGNEIDHFAHKAVYPQFSFNTVNLFYACKFCNSASIKGQKPTVSTLSNHYQQCTFTILHPYFHDIDTEIIFSDLDKIYFDFLLCSQIAKDTIYFFKYDELLMTTVRSKTLVMQRLQPLTTTEENALIQECIAYKR